MRLLRGRVRDYAWGSRTAIARLTGRPVPSPEPEAELWLGAHPDGPAEAPDGPLDRLITQQPDTMLGLKVATQFGPRLPYLLKVLAADEPLSLQAHPDSKRAFEAYAAGHPNYRDPYHKPELLVARTTFAALCGFADPDRSAALLTSAGIDVLTPVMDALRGPGSPAHRLRATVHTLLRWPTEDRHALTSALASSRLPLACDLAGRYPGDIGAALALLLNHVRLAPDEAVFMPAGNLHAYLSGIGVEVMAASDNVVRAGLTPKPVDPAELLRILRFETLPDPIRQPRDCGSGVITWPVPIPDFVLHKATVTTGPIQLPNTGPRILLCTDGAPTARAGTGTVTLAPGTAAFVAAGEPAAELSGSGEVFQAGTGL